MTQISAQVRFSTPSGAAINTFHFSNAAADFTATSDAAVAALTLFYNAPAGAGASIGANMASWVERNFEIRTYNLADLKPRVPKIYAVTLPAAANPVTSNKVPMDTAVCLSYHCAPPITRRRRGRIYLCGLTSEWLSNGAVGGTPVTISAFIITKITAAALALATGGANWCLDSRATGVDILTQIVGGYVDTEPDTQRRRGMKVPTGKTLWGS